MPRVRKGAVQIRFEIMEFLFYNHEPQLRTYIWRKATSLSYDDFLKHLEYLKEKNIIEETNDGLCKITNEGKRIYTSLRDSLRSIL